MPRLHGSNA
ncbi:hypothetical protein RDI58_027105 [Solanum bulbocastanum]|uniref:Uncharacterized protein n=1 Tax=Solanum bulbocastanum TaxID=147425 RepID=A0AAN8SY57_SOLBU